jgi:hypothetical protein
MSSTRDATIITTNSAVLALFVPIFVISVVIVSFLIRLRSGLYDPEAVPIFLRLFVFGDYWPAIGVAVVVPLALVRPVQRVALAVAAEIEARLPAVLAAIFILLCAGSLFLYRMHPLSMDEYAPYFQSQVFAAGHLTGQFPAKLVDWLVPPGFQNAFLFVSHETGQVVSSYWPGFALLLAPFTSIGLPWLLNPLIGVASVWITFRLARHFNPEPCLVGTGVLMAMGSGALMLNAISFYSMSAHAMLNGLFVLMLLQPTPRRCAFAGLVGSVALVLHNPLPHMLFALPWIAWLFVRPDRFRNIPAMVAGYLPICLLLGVGWPLFAAGVRDAGLTSSADTRGFVESWASTLSSVFTLPSEGLLQARAMGLGKLWIWATPGMLIFALVGWWRGRRDVHVNLLALSCAFTLVGFIFVKYDQGHGWGFRYFHSAWLGLPVLAALAIATPASAHSKSTSGTPKSFAAALALLSLLIVLPIHAWNMQRFVAAHLAQEPSTDFGTPRIIVISPAMGYYTQDLVQNDPFLRGPVIRMISHGRQANSSLISGEFPGLVRLSTGYRGEIWGER